MRNKHYLEKTKRVIAKIDNTQTREAFDTRCRTRDVFLTIKRMFLNLSAFKPNAKTTYVVLLWQYSHKECSSGYCIAAIYDSNIRTPFCCYQLTITVRDMINKVTAQVTGVSCRSQNTNMSIL